MSAPIPGRTWLNSRQGGFSNGQALVIEPTDPSEKSVGVWIAVDGDGPTVQLTPAQCWEIANSLLVRADLIDDVVAAEIVDEGVAP
jgi:hypothetical protein